MDYLRLVKLIKLIDKNRSLITSITTSWNNDNDKYK